MNHPVYEIISLQQTYADKPVLSIDHLSVQPGSIVGLIGPNGSGKSTLLKLLGLIEKPTRGTIRFNGRNVVPFSGATRFRVTMLPQEPFLMKRSVFKNISYGLKLKGVDSDIKTRVERSLERLGLDGKEFAKRPWYALSSGEAQRVALAARLALNPKVLLLDEPTASVDSTSAQLIKEASLKTRHKLGTTLIVASHDWQWLYEICDEILHLFRGRIIGTGRETIIFGPWQCLGPGKWGKLLPDRQKLLVSRPPSPEAAAVIGVLPIREDTTDNADDIILKGTVSRLSLERKTGHLFATILVGDLPFTVRFRPEHNMKTQLFPGRGVSIRYRPDQIRWV